MQNNNKRRSDILIYLDNAATTMPYPEVIDVMVKSMNEQWGNPSAQYEFGDISRQVIENVREQIAKDINASPDEIIFTSGASESNSLAICGYLDRNKDAELWTTNLEHASIKKIVDEKYTNAHILRNDKFGFVNIDRDVEHFASICSSFSKSKHLFSVGAANGEIGTIQNVQEIGLKIHELGGVFHTDATQLFPERRIDVQELNIDMMSVSSQKLHGPKGVGFLYVKNGVELNPIIYGSQENGMRGGTYNTPAIAGMGKALEMTRSSDSTSCVSEMRNSLLHKLLQISGVSLNGAEPGQSRLANNISICIDGVSAEMLVTLCSLNGVYISKGSACQSYEKTPSHVLKAIGLTDENAFNTIRITLDASNTKSQIENAMSIIIRLIERIREDV